MSAAAVVAAVGNGLWGTDADAWNAVATDGVVPISWCTWVVIITAIICRTN